METFLKLIDWTHLWAYLFFATQAEIWLTPLLPGGWLSFLMAAAMTILFLLIWPIFKTPL